MADQSRRLEAKLEAHNFRGVRFSGVAREERIEEYPMEALRRLARDADMHRSLEAATRHEADLVLIDAGPNLGAINRAALVASSHVVAAPVAPDLFSLQGLKNLRPTRRKWRDIRGKTLPQAASNLGSMPQGAMSPAGYVLMQHAERLRRPTKAYAKWGARLPAAYLNSVLGLSGEVSMPDPNQIQCIKHYRSLAPMAMEARKPMFDLTCTDGAIGAHPTNVQLCREDFETLCREIARRVQCGKSANRPPA